jgi:hypothetical protein
MSSGEHIRSSAWFRYRVAPDELARAESRKPFFLLLVCSEGGKGDNARPHMGIDTEYQASVITPVPHGLEGEHRGHGVRVRPSIGLRCRKCQNTEITASPPCFAREGSLRIAAAYVFSKSACELANGLEILGLLRGSPLDGEWVVSPQGCGTCPRSGVRCPQSFGSFWLRRRLDEAWARENPTSPPAIRGGRLGCRARCPDLGIERFRDDSRRAPWGCDVRHRRHQLSRCA